jgi:hypothetical protein
MKKLVIILLLVLIIFLGVTGFLKSAQVENYIKSLQPQITTNPSNSVAKKENVTAPEIDVNKEFYDYTNKEFGIKMKVPVSIQESVGFDPNCKYESKIKVFYHPETNDLFFYPELVADENTCYRKLDPMELVSDREKWFGYYRFKVFKFDSRKELESIIQKYLGEKCKIDTIKLTPDKTKKIVVMDESFFKSKEFKSQGPGVPYWAFCAYPGKFGSPMIINLKENKVMFHLYAHEAAKFVTESPEGWRNIYDGIFEDSIKFID